ncbi:tyrosine-type recombinase/integrase [Streptomyces griseorubiginosus]|uniref:tyrosine-type recombinase/integrase n=1 Tax=Streptomyces griseorubiginosus TaxID=67304 RepID=UPI0036E8CF5C
MQDEEVPLPPNIVSRLGGPRQTPSQYKVTTRSVSGMAAAMRAVAPQYEIAVWLGACAGLRLSEALGMTWGNIDMVHNRLSVTQQLFRREVRPLKTKSSRATLPMDPFLTDKLRAHWDAFPPEADQGSERIEGPFSSTGWIMVNSNKDPLTSQNFAYRWNAARSSSGIPPEISFHSLRHYYISMLAQSGRYSLTTVQSLARHGCIRSTLGYVRTIDSPDETGIHVFSAAFAQRD